MTIKQQGGIFGRNPSFNDVEVNKLDVDNIQVDGNTISSTNTNGNVTITPDGSGRVVATNATIGGTDNTNPSLIVHSSNTNNAYLKFGSTGNVYGIIAGDYQGQMNLYTGNHDITFSPGGTNRIKFKTGGNIDMVSGGGNVLFASGAGIDFSATSGTGTSELFDDYEEGTWTPQITFATAGDLSVSYSEQNGSYVKIGKLVVVRCRFVTSTFTHSTASGNVHITGLPFSAASGNNKNFQAVGLFGGVTKANHTQFSSQASPANSYLQTQSFGSGQAVANVGAGDVPSGATVNYCSVIAYEV